MDTNPRMPAAGVAHIGDLDRAAYCVQPDLDPRGRAFDVSANGSMSPSQIKWRTSFRREPGQRFIHAGLVDAPIHPPNYRHGIKTQGGDRAGDVFMSTQGGAESDLSSFHNLQKESIYRSNIREPLGSGYIRGHQFPSRVHEADFRFGASTSESENAKHIIYNPTAAPYLRSHGAVDTTNLNESSEQYSQSLRSVTTNRAANEGAAATMARTGAIGFTPSTSFSGTRTVSAGALNSPNDFDPMHQERMITRPINREYNWNAAGIDPRNHRFGKVASDSQGTGSGRAGAGGGVASIMQHASLDADSRTTIGSKRVEECKSSSFDHLGKGRRQRGELLGGDPSDPVSSSGGGNFNYTGHRNLIFGRPGQHDEWGARDCIRGDYTIREQMPDANLGRSSFKLTSLPYIPPVDTVTSRTFGLPSIRADRAPPKIKSVANDMNYGDESNGKGLLYPSAYAGEGVNEEDFLRGRQPAQIRQVFETLGLRMDDEQFNRVASLAQQRYGALSVDSFRHAWNQAVRLAIICEICGETLCQHEDCASQSCKHNEQANHALHSRHIKQEAATQIQAAGFSSNTHPAM